MLRIVSTSAAPAAEKMRQRIKRMPKPLTMLQCRCGLRSLRLELLGAQLSAGKVRGRTKAYICTECDRKGERVVTA